MSVVTDARDYLKSVVADAEAQIAKHQGTVQAVNDLVAKLDAEVSRVPSLDDVRALLDRIAADNASTKQ